MKTFTTAFALCLLCSSVFAHDSAFDRRDVHAKFAAKRAVSKRDIVPAGALMLAPEGYKAPSVAKLGSDAAHNASAAAKVAVKPATAAITNTKTGRAYSGPATVYTLGTSAGACKTQYKNTDFVIALPSSMYNSTAVSSDCGQRIVVTNSANRKQIRAFVATDSKIEQAKLSRGLFSALGGGKSGQNMNIEFALGAVSATTAKPTTATPTPTINSKSLASVKSAKIAAASLASGAASKSSVSAAAANSSKAAAAASSSSAAAASASQKAAADKAAAQKAADDAAAKQEAEKEAAQKAAADQAAADKAAADKAAADKAAADKAAADQAAADKAAADKAAADKAAAAQKAQDAKNAQDNQGGGNGGGAVTGGFATYYMQNGIPGNCGKVSAESDKIIALPTATYAGGAHCGKQIRLTRTDNGKSVVATVQDSCPTCVNDQSLDLSVGAFTQIATEDEGMVPISWVWA